MSWARRTCLLLPAAFVTLLLVLPLGFTFVVSFWRRSMLGMRPAFLFTSYADFLTGTRLVVLWRSLLISIEATAALTGLSADHVRRHVTSGLLSASNLGTFDKPYYRIHRRDIDEWMAKRRETAIPAPKKKPSMYISRHHR